jgi:predicted transcriptional regulator
MKKNALDLLNEIIAGFDARIKKLGITKRRFCELSGVHENTMYYMKNPTIETLNKIEMHLREMEAKK